jgi:Family of unknown function (DUF5990)
MLTDPKSNPPDSTSQTRFPLATNVFAGQVRGRGTLSRRRSRVQVPSGPLSVCSANVASPSRSTSSAPRRIRHDWSVQIRIDAQDLPGLQCHPGPDAPCGHTGIRVGVQRRGDPHQILDPVPGDAASATWILEATVLETSEGIDVAGPYIQGRRHQRFIHLSWLSDQGPGPLGMFRRGRISLESIPATVLHHAAAGGAIEVTVRLTDERGNPACATLGPAAVSWRAG